MPRTIARSERMEKVIVLRATTDDVAQLKLTAQGEGLDVSTYIRQLLIKAKAINPQGAAQNKTDW